MAEEIVMTVKSNVKQVTQDTKDWSASMSEAEKSSAELNQQVDIQNKVLVDMEKELRKLEEAQAKMGKGSWKDSLTGTTKKIEKQKQAIKSEKTALKDLKLQQKDATKAVKKYTDAQKQSQKAISGTIGNFQVMGVSLNGIKKSIGGVIPLVKTLFASIKAGIASTGIGVLLLAFGALVTYFTSTKEGMDKIQVAIAKVSAAIDVIKDRISKFGGAILKVFKGDFSGAAKDMKESIQGIGEEIKKETKAAGELAVATQKLRDANNDFIIQQAKKNKAIAEARLLAKDETLSQEERIAALKNAVALEKEMLQEQLANQAEKVRILEEQTNMSNSTAADEKALAEEKARLIDMETTSIMKMRTLKRETNTLENELAAEELERLQMIADEKQRIADEEEEARLAREEAEAERLAIKAEEDQALKDLQNENMLAEIEDLKERALMEIEIEYAAELEKIKNYENFELMKEEIDKKYARAKEALNKQELKWDEITTKQKMNLAKQGFDNLATILGKESKAGKAAAIASATISTFQGATSAFASLAPIPFVGPALGGIAAAAAIVAGFKNIQAIRKGGGASSGGGGGGGGNMSASSPAPPSIEEAGPAAEMMGGAFDLGNVGAEPDPVKAFVVTDEMTDSQDQLQDIRNRSTI